MKKCIQLSLLICLLYGFSLSVTGQIVWPHFTMPKNPEQEAYIKKQLEGTSAFMECYNVDEAVAAPRQSIVGYVPIGWSDVMRKGFESAGLTNIKPDGSNLCSLMRSASFIEMCNVYKYMLFDASGTTLRQLVINDAIRNAFGREANPADYGIWETKMMKDKKDWYIAMLKANTDKMNNSKVLHTFTIQNAFNAMFGRKPNEVELQKWMASTDNYEHIYYKLRDWLYSSDGANELNETVKRYFKSKNKAYSQAQFNEKLDIARIYKMSYEIMLEK